MTAMSRTRSPPISTSWIWRRRASAGRGSVAMAALRRELASTLAESATQRSRSATLWWNWWRMVSSSSLVRGRSFMSDPT